MPRDEMGEKMGVLQAQQIVFQVKTILGRGRLLFKQNILKKYRQVALTLISTKL